MYYSLSLVSHHGEVEGLVYHQPSFKHVFKLLIFFLYSFFAPLLLLLLPLADWLERDKVNLTTSTVITHILWTCIR